MLSYHCCHSRLLLGDFLSNVTWREYRPCVQVSDHFVWIVGVFSCKRSCYCAVRFAWSKQVGKLTFRLSCLRKHLELNTLFYFQKTSLTHSFTIIWWRLRVCDLVYWPKLYGRCEPFWAWAFCELWVFDVCFKRWWRQVLRSWQLYYCLIVSTVWLTREVFENKAAKVLLNLPPRSSSTEALDRLDLKTLSEKGHFRIHQCDMGQKYLWGEIDFYTQ